MSYTGPLNNAPVDPKLLICLKMNIDLNSRMLPLQQLPQTLYAQSDVFLKDQEPYDVLKSYLKQCFQRHSPFCDFDPDLFTICHNSANLYLIVSGRKRCDQEVHITISDIFKKTFK